MRRSARALILIPSLALLASLGLASLEACSEETVVPNNTATDATTTTDTRSNPRDSQSPVEEDAGEGDPKDAGKDSSTKDSATSNDASCPGPIVTTTNGETCTGFGISADTCDPGCGQPAGYLCVGGGPPGFTGCREKQTTTFGNTYCCPENKCVAQPDQNSSCTAVDKPNRFQCPPKPGGGHVAPAAQCVDMSEDGGNDLEKYYCCP